MVTSEEEVGGGQQGQSEHPEPEQQVNLLINYIEGEDTDAVELLLPRGCPHSVKCAARHRGEDCTHGVWHLEPVLLVVTEVLHHLGAVLHESAR